MSEQVVPAESKKDEASVSPTACPSCRNEATQPCHAVFNAGTSSVASSARGGGIAFGSDGMVPVMASGSTTGMQQTNLAKLCAPPEKKRSGKTFFVSLFIITGFTLIAGCTGNVASGSDKITALTGLFTFLFCGAIAMAVTVKDITFNRREWPVLYGDWSKRWICLRCHHQFMPNTGTPLPSPEVSSSKRFLIGPFIGMVSTLSVIFLVMLVFFAAHVGRKAEAARNGDAEVSSGSMKRVDWLARVIVNLDQNQTSVLAGVINCPRDRFYKEMGKPDQVQEIGDDAILYYTCSDGTIQLVCNKMNLEANGILATTAINEL